MILRLGTYLLRAALIGGLYIVALFLVSMYPKPGVSWSVIEVLNILFEIALVVGLVAPVLAISGAIILWVKKRRFGALDWISLAIGLVALLLPVMFVLAYSNCPNGVC